MYPPYFLQQFASDAFNLLDAALVLINAGELFFLEKRYFSVLRILRLLRIIKLARSFPNLQAWMNIVVQRYSSVLVAEGPSPGLCSVGGGGLRGGSLVRPLTRTAVDARGSEAAGKRPYGVCGVLHGGHCCDGGPLGQRYTEGARHPRVAPAHGEPGWGLGGRLPDAQDQEQVRRIVGSTATEPPSPRLLTLRQSWG